MAEETALTTKLSSQPQQATNSSNQLISQPSQVLPQHSIPSDTFSIATPVVTSALTINGNLNDTSFLHPATPSHQGFAFEPASMNLISEENKQRSPTKMDTVESNEATPVDTVTTCPSKESTTSNSQTNDRREEAQEKSNTICQSANDDLTHVAAQDDASKLHKKRNKPAKKNTKLDAKSKLEKSRQSARECRARKKLRYQYLEDLVCNREKAVIKLREELSMFCELSKQIDIGTISEKDRQLLMDQIKENNNA